MRKNGVLPFSHIRVCFFLFLYLAAVKNSEFLRVAEAGKRRMEIPDDLDDVIDDEEDESWKEWGKKKTASQEFDLPPPDFSKMEMSEIQAEIMKRQSGPAIGFVKLRLGIRRSPEMVAGVATEWAKVLRTGGLEAKFMGVDSNTIMFTMERGKDAEELKEFLLSQPEAYEIKIGDQVFRRPGDPSLEDVVDKLRGQKSEADDGNKDEL